MLDQPTTIRAGEELDAERLSAYLAHNLSGFAGKVAVQQFPSGFSNLTYSLEANISGAPKQFVLRRAPFGANIKSAHDMEREFAVLKAVRAAYPRVPEALLYCDDADVIGAPFYVMERVEGVILRGKPPKDIDTSAPVMKRLSTLLVDNMAQLHSIDIASNPALQALGKPDNTPGAYTRRQIEGWTQRYERARTDDIAGMERAAEWLAANLPNSSAATLIHNDYKYDNVVFAPDMTRISAVLDWEMATIGDPLMDLGTTLGYWAEAGDADAVKMFGLTHLAGNLTRGEVVARYAAQTGHDVSNVVFYYVFGLFKIGVIAQQIYARFKKGFTSDARFGDLIFVIQANAAMAEKALESGKISGL